MDFKSRTGVRTLCIGADHGIEREHRRVRHLGENGVRVAERRRGEGGQGEDEVLGEKRVGDGDARAERARVDLLENGEGLGACSEKSHVVVESAVLGEMHITCLLICMHRIVPSLGMRRATVLSHK